MPKPQKESTIQETEENQPYFDPDRERAPTVTASGQRRWLYPDRRPGPFALLRFRLAMVLIVIYFALPFVTVSGRPLVRFDLQNNLIYFFGGLFRVNDPIYFVFVPIFLALFLFLVTALKGRIWCGYACPQTVFVEWVVRPIEEWLEGHAHRRQRQDANPWSWSLRARKVIKHLIFLGFSAIVANVFLAYFVAPETLMKWILSSPFDHPTPFAFMAGILAVFYFDLAWFREQFCTFLCPYARFQSVMMDDATPAVSYDVARGEPRGRRAKGDCIDCGLCVRVCPTGIDIRDGLQLECIQCNRCVDACDSVMASIKRPLRLIGHSSPASRQGVLPWWRNYLRMRVIIYGCLLLATSVAMIAHLYLRPIAEVKFVRQPGMAYSTLPDGRHANLFYAYVNNNSHDTVALDLKIITDDVELICGQCNTALKPGEKRQMTVIFAVSSQAHLDSIKRVEVEHASVNKSYFVPLILPELGSLR